MSFDALVSLQKENARLRQLLAAKEQPVTTVSAPARKPKRPIRGEEEDELESDEDSTGDLSELPPAASDPQVVAPRRLTPCYSSSESDESDSDTPLSRKAAEKARLAALTARLEAGMKKLEKGKAELLDRQRQLEKDKARVDNDTTRLQVIQQELTAAQARLDESRRKGARQATADEQQARNQIEEERVVVKNERKENRVRSQELKQEWERLSEWKTRLEEDRREMHKKMAQLNDGRQTLLEQIERLEGDIERLKQGSAFHEKERLLAESQARVARLSAEKDALATQIRSLQHAKSRLVTENNSRIQHATAFQAHVVQLMGEKTSIQSQLEGEKAELVRLNNALSEKFKNGEEKLAQAVKAMDDLRRMEISRIPTSTNPTPNPPATPTIRAMMGPTARNLQGQILNPHKIRRTESPGTLSIPQSTPHKANSGRASSPIMLLSPPPSSSPAPQPTSPSRKRTRAAYENGGGQENVRPVGRMGPIDIGGAPHKKPHTTPSATAPLPRQPFMSSLSRNNTQPPQPQENTRLCVPQGKLSVGGAPNKIPYSATSLAPAWPLAYPPSTALSVNNAPSPGPQMELQKSLHYPLLFSSFDKHYIKCRLCPPSPYAYVTAKSSPWDLLVEHVKYQHLEEYDVLLRLKPEQLGEWQMRLRPRPATVFDVCSSIPPREHK